MEFGQLIEYNMRNTFLEKSFTRCCRETIPGSFVIILNRAYLWINPLLRNVVKWPDTL